MAQLVVLSKGLLLIAALLSVHAPWTFAGIIVTTDQSPECQQNLRLCAQSCPPPQNWVYACSSGGTFGSPQLTCNCVDTPAAGTPVQGVGQLKIFQLSDPSGGPQPCKGNQWIYNCAQTLNVQVAGSDIQAVGSVAQMTSTPSLSPTTAQCGQPIQGIATSATSAIFKVPTWDLLGQVSTRGNDTVVIVFGDASTSQCTAGYKLVQGSFLGMGQAPAGDSLAATAADNSTALAGPKPGEYWSKKSGAAHAALGSLLLAAPALAALAWAL